MSLAARCPHCSTLFRLSAEQLSAAEGWARCGVCTQVFEASAHLCEPDGSPLELPELAREVTLDSPSPSVDGSSFGGADPLLQRLPDIDLELPDLSALDAPEPAGATTAEPVPIPPVDAEAVKEVQIESAPPPEAPAVDAMATVPRDLRGTAPATTHAGSSAASGSRLGDAFLGLVLLLTLAALSAYAARGHIAQTWPDSRPLLIEACEWLNCRLPALRSLEGLSVESSSMSLDSDDGLHRLRLSLKNAGDMPLMVPALDLSLLGDDGQVLARRALLPDELELADNAVPPRTNVQVAVRLNLKSLEASSISSFRVEPFHP